MRPNTLAWLAYERLVLDVGETVYEMLFYPLLVGLVAGPVLFVGTFVVFGFWDTLGSFAFQGSRHPAVCLLASVLWLNLGILVGCFGWMSWMAGCRAHTLLR